MIRLIIPLIFCCALVTAHAADVTLTRKDDRIVVKADGELFTEYRLKDRRPCLFPVFGPNGNHMTRCWPLDESNAANESQDHPHHTGVYYAHGDVRLEGEQESSDFWHHQKVEVVEVVDFEENEKLDSLVCRHSWQRADGSEVCRDLAKIRFGGDADSRWIDYTITIYAPDDQALIMGDTKEGTFAIRVPEQLAMETHSKELRVLSNGQIETSEGHRGRKAWGKRAKWCAFYGALDEQPTVITIFDHPQNPRHPTWWMARHYGLFTANAFGQSYFEKKPRGSGDFTIAAGESATFRYQLLFLATDYDKSAIEKHYREWVGATD